MVCDAAEEGSEVTVAAGSGFQPLTGDSIFAAASRGSFVPLDKGMEALRKLPRAFLRQGVSNSPLKTPYGPPWEGICEKIEDRLFRARNVRSARVLTCGFGDGTDQGWLNSIFSQPQALGVVLEGLQPDCPTTPARFLQNPRPPFVKGDFGERKRLETRRTHFRSSATKIWGG